MTVAPVGRLEPGRRRRGRGCAGPSGPLGHREPDQRAVAAWPGAAIAPARATPQAAEHHASYDCRRPAADPACVGPGHASTTTEQTPAQTQATQPSSASTHTWTRASSTVATRPVELAGQRDRRRGDRRRGGGDRAHAGTERRLRRNIPSILAFAYVCLSQRRFDAVSIVCPQPVQRSAASAVAGSGHGLGRGPLRALRRPRGSGDRPLRRRARPRAGRPQPGGVPAGHPRRAG